MGTTERYLRYDKFLGKDSQLFKLCFNNKVKIISSEHPIIIVVSLRDNKVLRLQPT